MNFPFENVKDDDFGDLVNRSSVLENLTISSTVRNYLYGITKNEEYKELDCKYYTTDEFNTRFCNASNSSDRGSTELSAMHLNIRSLNSKTQAFCTFISLIKMEFDVIVLSEIWSYNIAFYSKLLDGYTLYFDLPVGSNVGGIGMFVRESLTCKIRNDLRLPKHSNYKVENLWLEIAKNNKSYIVGGIYRHPNQNINTFSSLIESTLCKLKQCSCSCIILGDMNVDLIKTDSMPDIKQYVNTLLVNNCQPTLLLPTRISTKSCTLIDHIYYKSGTANNIKYDVSLSTGNILTDLSDHFCTFVLISSNKITHKSNERPFIRLFTEKNKNSFNAKLADIDWKAITEFSQLNKNVNACYDKFIDIIQGLFDECFPLTRLSRKAQKDKAWVTKAIRVSSHTKDKLFKQWLSSKSYADETKYKMYRKLYKKVLTSAQTAYYSRLFDSKTVSIKSLWKNLNRVCSATKKKKEKNSVDFLDSGNGTLRLSKEISNTFNKFFSSVGAELTKNLPTSKTPFNSYMQNVTPQSIFVAPVTQCEILTTITKLKNKTSSGHDGVNTCLIKENKYVLSEPLEILYNMSLASGCVPDKLKIAKVIPLYKNGEKSVVSNYRPISLLSVFNKILEKLVYSRVYNFLNKCNSLYDYQFGFRKNYSTSLALLETLDNCYASLDKKDYVLGIYLDVAKAFDSVDHNILLHKLNVYGIRGVMYDWFKDYLTNRKQFTVVNGVYSDHECITCGVPQGSVLGPLLFLIYINDIHVSVTDCKLKLFADDTNMFLFGSDLKLLESKANLCIENIVDWFTANKLSVNVDKTCYTLFTPKGKPKTNFEPNLIINGHKLNRTSCCKYLGVFIDQSLNFESHIENICKKITKFAGIFYKLRGVLPPHVMHKLYFAFVYPHLLFGIEVYGSACKTQLTKLHTLNNKLLRILLNKKLDTPICDLYKAMGTLSIFQLHDFQMLTLACKGIHCRELIPSVFHQFFVSSIGVHTHSTRNISSLYRDHVRTGFGARTIKYHCGKLWNNLPVNLRQVSSIHVFKRKVKEYLMLSLNNGQ